jgi:hypothetical protein
LASPAVDEFRAVQVFANRDAETSPVVQPLQNPFHEEGEGDNPGSDARRSKTRGVFQRVDIEKEFELIGKFARYSSGE